MTGEAEPKPKVIGNTDVTLGALRKKCWTSLTPKLAHDVNLPLDEAASFMALRSVPEQATLTVLARRLGLL